MNYIESVEIEGFWGRKNVSLQLNPDLNFLIGPNRSGKTTIINLVSAVLRADIPALYSVQFDKVTIKMKAVGTNRKPVIEVAKEVDPKMAVSNSSTQSERRQATREPHTASKARMTNVFTTIQGTCETDDTAKQALG